MVAVYIALRRIQNNPNTKTLLTMRRILMGLQYISIDDNYYEDREFKQNIFILQKGLDFMQDYELTHMQKKKRLEFEIEDILQLLDRTIYSTCANKVLTRHQQSREIELLKKAKTLIGGKRK